MAGSQSFRFTIGTGIDLSGFKSGMEAIRSQIKVSPDIDLKVQMPNLDTGEAQKAVDSLKQQGLRIENLTVKTKSFVTSTGQLKTEIAGLTAVTKDSLGNVATHQVKVNSAMEAFGEKIKSYDSLNNKAKDWSARAENMGKKEKEAVQATTKKVTELVNEYERLGKAGNTTGAAALIPQIEKAKEAMDKTIASTKMGAGVIRSWSDNLKNAIQQTISYSLSLGAVRQAQKLLNDAIQYAIELNKEMVKIQVLQVEGAQTDAEIKSLANSYNDLAKSMGVTTIEIAKGSVEWLNSRSL